MHEPNYAMGWELSNRRAIRQGNWKLLWDKAPFGDDRWTLYNLEDDPNETNDLSGQRPQQLAIMIALWEDYRVRNNVIMPEH